MFNTILIEIVQTGDDYTAFVLKPYECKPEKVVSSMFEHAAEQIALACFPTATIVDVDSFVAEVEQRTIWTMV